MQESVLPAARQAAFERLAADLREIFGDAFVSLVAVDGTRSVAFAERVTPGDLGRAAHRAEAWADDDLDVPLVLTPDEFRRSLDTFPVEYGAILAQHVVIAGTPPFEGARVSPDHLRRAVEAQAKGHVLHLRAGIIATHGRETEGRDLLRASVDPFRAVLLNAARLAGATPQSDDELAAFAGTRLGLDEQAVRAVLAAETGAFDPSTLAATALGVAEELWKVVDRW